MHTHTHTQELQCERVDHWRFVRESFEAIDRKIKMLYLLFQWD